MDRVEKANELMELAEKLGVRLEFRSGLIVAVKQTESDDPERQDAILAELVKHLSSVRVLVKGRAIADCAKDLLGQRTFFLDGFNLSTNGQGVLSGVLSDASSDGSLTISIKKEGLRSPQMLTSNADSLLIVLNEEGADGDSSPNDGDPKTEQPRKGFFERLRRSHEE
jgi:hypothetical protein